MKNSLLGKKIAWTFGIVFLYLLGRTIPIGTVSLNAAMFQSQVSKNLMAALASVSGGQFEMTTLFTLGIGPYMTMMILWRSLMIFNVPGITSLTKKVSWFWQNILVLTIGIIQAFGLTASLTYVSFAPSYLDNVLLGRLTTMVVLISGSMVLTWLTQVNTRYGLGGPVIIILVNMCLNLLENARSLFAECYNRHLIDWVLLVGFIALLLGLVFWTVLIYRAEYRIPLRRISIYSRFAQSTYLPIRLMPAGGMPFMYSMTLMTIPPLLFQGLLSFFPESVLLQYWLENSSLDTLPGAIIYLLILYILSIGFAYFNYDAQKMTKQFQYHGDYIDQIRPGKATYCYIQRTIRLFAHFGAFLVTLVGGLPILINLYAHQPIHFTMMVSNSFIMINLMMTIAEQVEALRIWEQYDPLV
ncbi:accessory Sec system protein translocase subunit SecY2 [Streptococcus dysgalactiae]|uniref:accessory Sec system protein translocase subunit SecY2 n=1 Tax=Streptococcus dysgalactiae TaxID=1334 RepID=UPI001CF58C1A|nr:accessory Sec system protein translocase subunit SecY2 [Streptococcus dysgalactiae]MCB2834386.1 accessory Sec system protein translocase subunit SecY2 [Streptococcus dysgalactiae subsp. dysgalactiae]MCB2848210.1 accessory Sec system protein translocase subunit SecY2 [Streptococcus dysgalactiae subsp. dysgalactiae]